MSRYNVSVLASDHQRDSFSCGEPSLDDYLKRQARQDVTRGLAICYVLTEPGNKQALGYYTLSAATVDLSALPEELRRHSGKYPVVPAVLLGRVAVHERLRGTGLGAALLADALQRAARTGVGVKLVLVDALNDIAARFYEHHGFRRFEGTPTRLFLPLSAVTDLLPESLVAEHDAGDQ